MLARHPWIAGLAVTRPPLGPGVIGKCEHELAAFDGIGLTDVEMDAAPTHLLGFVHVNALAAADAAAHNGRQSDEEWWAVSAPLLERAMGAERYPLAEARRQRGRRLRPADGLGVRPAVRPGRAGPADRRTAGSAVSPVSGSRWCPPDGRGPGPRPCTARRPAGCRRDP
ncbi:TetR/AcrR family transcriptional regulator C-terminal domain-containing protein [Streptomyces sp. NPDC060031]|uniref:TetR/AcrR family transcriptional regulator C-terminal domain-containing protein n=1 Tax=Streptomyces sp. NPDC060031 TaxID=3347043 RepID=UPI0036C2C7CD